MMTGRVGVVSAQLVEHLEPGHPGHLQIEQDDVGLEDGHEL
jgi:hypothetical protein